MQLIARTAEGSSRDAVGLLNQLVPLASGPISLESARALLGIADPRLLDSLLDDVLAGRASEALAEVDRVDAGGRGGRGGAAAGGAWVDGGMSRPAGGGFDSSRPGDRSAAVGRDGRAAASGWRGSAAR